MRTSTTGGGRGLLLFCLGLIMTAQLLSCRRQSSAMNAVAAVGPTRGLLLTIEVPEERCTVGQSISVTARLRNVGKHSLRVLRFGAEPAPHFLQVDEPCACEWSVEPYFWREDEMLVLAPGEVLEEKFSRVLRRPGERTIWADYIVEKGWNAQGFRDLWIGWLRSNTVQVTVREKHPRAGNEHGR